MKTQMPYSSSGLVLPKVGVRRPAAGTMSPKRGKKRTMAIWWAMQTHSPPRWPASFAGVSLLALGAPIRCLRYMPLMNCRKI
eukprot:11173439-Lingulodinium_polyedra.AAC.1